MSSTAAQAADSATARNFNPSWIRSAFHGGGVNSTPRASTNDEELDTHLSQPVLSKNRYGREEVLVLMPNVPRAPKGLNNCPFFVPDPREPLALQQPNELEQRLQSNINSSKAMSSLTPAERMNIAGNLTSPNGAGGPNSPQTRIASNGWTPVKSNSSWGGRGASQAGGTTNGRGSLTRAVGRGAPPVSQADEGSSPFGQQKFAYRGRGGLTTARGGSTTATNSRAQGLYDPRDPKDRPRNRLRSTSEEADGNEPNNGDAGWSRVNQFGRQNSNAWNKDECSAWGGNADKENVSGNAMKSESTGTMPEWMDDDDVSDKPEQSIGGSFDDEGRYRQPPMTEPVRHAPAPSWRPVQQPQPDSLKERATTSAFSGLGFSQPSPSIAQVAPGVPLAPGVSMAPGIPMASPAAPATPPEFYYMDPSEKERGPFKKEQMEAWFKMGYFADNLKVRRSTDTAYKTLGELKHQNGALTAFDYKEPQAFLPVLQAPGAPFTGNIFSGSVWNDPLSSVYNPSSVFGAHNISAAFDTKRMEEEARRMEFEKQAALRDLMYRQHEEQQKVLLEKEMAFRMKEEEMKRLFEEDRLRRELDQLELQKKVKQLEAEKMAREAEERKKVEEEMRKIEEERRREQAKLAEEQRRLDEVRRAVEEEHRRKEAELARKKEEEERKKRAEAAAEEHRKELQKKAEEDAARIRQQQAAAAAAAKAAEEEEKRRAAKDAEKMFNDHDAWNTSSVKTSSSNESNEGPWQTKATAKKTPSAKAPAAWSTVSQQNNASREKSLREIQEEEERQMAAEQRELARLRKEQESSSSASSMQAGMWSAASQRINWNQPAAAAAARAPSKPAWGGSTIESKPAASPAYWDGPSLQAANKPAAAPAKKQPVPAPAKQTPAKHTSAKTNNQASNSFTAWVVKRLKEISSTVDADVLASFLESVENPNEVDDYIEGYLGSSKATKEFVKEYLHRRCESRKRKDTDKDDLSSASKAGTGSGTVGHGKKKKGKGQRLVVDGSCLGFRAAADSNRVNQGEIETVGLAPGQKR